MTNNNSQISTTSSFPPSDWVQTTLGEVCEIKHGFAFKGEFITDQENENILLTPGNFEIGGGWKYGKKFYSGEIPENYILKYNDLVVTMTDLSKSGDTLGYPALIPNNPNKKFLHNQRIGLVIIKNKTDNLFLYYLMKWREYQKYIVNTATGSTVRHTSPVKISEFKFSLPPLPEQQAIASVLSSFDDKIELLREQNKTLEEIGQTIFQEWFGKYSVDRPEDLPEGWRVGKLSEIADFLNGIALQKFPAENENDYLPVIKIRELKAGITAQTDKASKNIDSKYIIDDGDVLFSWSGSLEVVIWQYGKGALNQHLFKVSSEKYPKWFYYFWTLYHLEDFRSIASNKATTMGHIQRHHLDQAQVFIPDDKTLQELDSQISPILEKIMLINQEIQSLARSRDTLLPKLMRGIVRVSDFNKN